MSNDRPVALITGASRGIGRAIAERLASDGFFVIINFFQNQQAAQNVLSAVEAISSGRIYQFDVGDEGASRDAIRTLVNEHGRINVLVNNAAMIRDQPFVRMRLPDWDDVLRVNLSGAYWCSQAVVKTWAGKTDPLRRIVNITSLAGEMGNAFQTNYSASKAGLIGLTKSLARELAPKGITVNAVSPGCIDTDTTKHLPRENVIPLIPLARFGAPREVAHVVAMLASPLAAYITGQVIRVDGGLNM